MSDSFSDIMPVLDKMWASETLQDVGEHLAQYGEHIGYKTVFVGSFGRLVSSKDHFPPAWTNADPEWIKFFLANDLYAIDPHVRMAACSSKPFSYETSYADETPNVIKYRKYAEAAGVNDGFTVPLHMHGIPSGMVQFNGPDTVVLDAKMELELIMLSHVTFEKAYAFFKKKMPELKLRLSDRERSVLTLVARGKTNWEVGQVLSISEYSVRDYLKRLSVKFETSNRTHTVSRAMQLGLIVP